MDSANGSYMQYNNNNNDDLTSFFNEVDHYASLENSSTPQYDPALFSENSLGSYHHQQPTQSNQATQSSFAQPQRPSQSPGPVLPPFKQTPNVYNGGQYNQSLYGQSSLQPFDPHLLSRTSQSPGPYDQYYQQHMNYGQPNFDYRFNSFQSQRQASTPSQPFRPQVAPSNQQYLNPSASSSSHQARTPQPQSADANGMYSYNPSHQTAQRFVEPSMLKNDHMMQPNIAQSQPMQTSPYFTMPTTKSANATLDPRALQMQQYAQQQQQQHPQQMLQQSQQPHQAQQVGMLQQMQGVQNGQMHHLFQMQPQGTSMATTRAIAQPKMNKKPKVSGSASSSDDDLEIEEEEPEQKPAAITIAKPSDERGKLLWEVVDAVWTPRNKPAAPEKIRSAISFIGTAVRNLRDKWKATNDQLKQAELPDSKSKSLTEGLKVIVSSYRETMESLAGRVARFGHPSILSRLGEHQVLLSALYSFLLDRVTAGDFNSNLVVGILQLGTKLTLLDEEQLEKVKWKKILDRFVNKATNESKDLARQVLENAKKATARKKAENSNQGPSSPTGSSSGQVAGVKRPREGSDTVIQAKKVVKPSSKPLSVQLAEQRRLKEKERSTSARDAKVEKSAVNGSNGTVPARPKVASAPPIKPSPFAGLMSASKRPGTTNAERATKVDVVRPVAPVIKKDTAVKPEVTAVKVLPSAVPAASSSLLGLLAEMEKPKEQPKVKIEVDPTESPEAREKRLRKEDRRKLRVTWKPEGQLVQTRIFEHDIDEETGHEDSMMRDVGDTGKEGEMLRKALQMKEVEEGEDDEFEYFSPSEVDFLEVTENSPDNFIRCGGSRTPESRASEMQAQHESGNMMTIFAAGEQPNTPQEPPEGDDDDFNPVVDFGDPSSGKVNVRQREQAFYERRQALQQPQTSGMNLSATLASLYPQQQATQTPQVSQQQDWLRSLGYLQTQPQIQAQQPAQPGLDLSQLMALVGQAQQQQQSAYQPQTMPQPSTSAPIYGQDIASILAQLQQPQGINNGLPVGAGDNPNPYPGSLNKDKRDIKKDKPKKGKGGAPLDANGLPLNYKTKVCQFWLKGICEKGDSCTFRHDHEGND